jgi:flagellar M-ring protein FliF
MVTAELDFDSWEKTAITFGDEGVPRSRSLTEESFEGSGGMLPAEAGTDSNIPGYVFTQNTGDAQYEHRNESVNYEVNETTERQLSAPGRLIRLNTAVVVNDKGGQLSQAQLQQIREIVASAVGFQNERGDGINVQGMNFDTSHVEEARVAMDEAAHREQIRNYATLGAALLAGLILLFMLMRLLRGWRERQLDAELSGLPTVAGMETAPKEVISPEEQAHQRIRQYADTEPEAVAHLLRAWMAEE